MPSAPRGGNVRFRARYRSGRPMSRRFGKLFEHARVSHNGVVSFLEPPMDREQEEKVTMPESREEWLRPHRR
jgi:hypothetical protein